MDIYRLEFTKTLQKSITYLLKSIFTSINVSQLLLYIVGRVYYFSSFSYKKIFLIWPIFVQIFAIELPMAKWKRIAKILITKVYYHSRGDSSLHSTYSFLFPVLVYRRHVTLIIIEHTFWIKILIFIVFMFVVK